MLYEFNLVRIENRRPVRAKPGSPVSHTALVFSIVSGYQ